MLTDLYPPYIGGIEQHVRNLGRGLVERGHEVSVATLGAPGEPAEQVDDGVRVHRIRSIADVAGGVTNPSGRPFAPPFPDPFVTAALRRVVAAERPDVVHAHNWMVDSFLPLKRWSRAKLVMSLHDYGVVCAKRSLLYRDAICSGPGPRKCLECAGAHYGGARGSVITLTNWASQPFARELVDLYLPVSNAVAEGNRLASRRSRFRVVPNFVPDDVADRADPDDPALAVLPSGGFVLYVGALSTHKGVDVALRAHERLGAATPLVLIGTPMDLPETLPPNVIVVPGLPHRAVMAAWRRALVGVVPSRFPDPCPTVVMEAMATGTPVVASRVGGIPDLVTDGETGYLAEPGRDEAFATALGALLTDEDVRERFARAARASVRDFMATAVVDRVEAEYLRLLGSRAA